jgi:hypothetical protein
MSQLLRCGEVRFAPTQHRFCSVRVGTVTACAEYPQPIAAPEGSEADFHRELASVFAQSVQFPAGAYWAQASVPLRYKRFDRFAYQLLAVIAKQLFGPGVHQQDAARYVRDH